MISFKFPIVAFHKNILFNSRGKSFAVYKLEAVPYRFLPEDRKCMVVGSFEEMLSGYQGTGQILILWDEIGMNEGGYFNRCVGKNLGEDLLNEMAEHTLAVRSAINDGARQLRRYILFELPNIPTLSNIQEFLGYARDLALRTFMTLRPMEIPLSFKKAAEESEKEFYSRMRRHGLSRARFSDLDFMIRKCSQRVGLLPPPLPDRPSGIMTPAAIAAFTDGHEIDERINYVVVTDGYERKHYQSFVHFVDLSRNIPAWGIDLFSAKEFAFPFDTCIHFEITAPNKALKKVDNKKRLLSAQMDEAIDAMEDVSVNAQDGIRGSRQLEQNLSEGKPLASVAISLAIGQNEAKEVNSQSGQLQSHYLGMNYRAVRPSSKQLESLMAFLPGSQPAAPKIECDPGYIAAMGPHFDYELGDPPGFFSGWAGQSPVYWAPGRSARELNKTNAIIIVGSLGGGKSVLAKLLAYFTLLAGGYVLVSDPKNEYWVFRLISSFQSITQVIDLSPRGKAALNPFILAKEEARAKSIALDYLSLALNPNNNENRQMCISQALERLYALPVDNRHMDAFSYEIALLERDDPDRDIKDEARKTVYQLQMLKQSDIGRMVYGQGQLGLFEDGQRMSVLNLSEIPRPRPHIPYERWTDSERQGIAITYLMAAITRETAFALPRDIPKLLIYDEAHVVSSTPQGEGVLDESIRMGRTYGLIPVLISQNMSDLDKPVFTNNVGQVFCFRAGSAEEAGNNLRVLGAGEGVVKPETFASLRSGQCLYRDAENRIGYLEVDVQPSQLLNVFDTNPDGSRNPERGENN